jgi:WD40 repeat protein
MRTGECLRVLEGHKDSVHAVSTTRDGRKVVSASADKTLRVWDLASGACLRVLEGHGMTVTCVGTSPEGGRAVSGSADKTLRVWDLETGDCLAVYYANDPIRAVAWAAGADCLVCGTERLGQMHFLAPVKFPPPPICPR